MFSRRIRKHFPIGILFLNYCHGTFYAMASMQGPIAKLERANEHVAQFEREIRSLINPNSYNVVVETDSATGNLNWCFRSPKPVLPLKLSTIVGDAMFNFRSALDQLVWQLVLANNQKPDRNNNFPIFIAHQFETKKKSSLKGVNETAFEIIKGCQPKPGNNMELLFLPKLNDIDKHRYLHLCVLCIQSTTGTFDSNLPASENEELLKAFSEVPTGNLEEGIILFSIPSKFKPRSILPRFDIGFSEESQIIPNEPVLEVMGKMSKQLQGIFSALKKEVEKI